MQEFANSCIIDHFYPLSVRNWHKQDKMAQRGLLCCKLALAAHNCLAQAFLPPNKGKKGQSNHIFASKALGSTSSSPNLTIKFVPRSLLYSRKSGRICVTVGVWIQITLVLVFIFSRYWSKSIIRAPPLPPGVADHSLWGNFTQFGGENTLLSCKFTKNTG